MTTPTATPNDGFITREDNALKRHLQGITVYDANTSTGGRPVKVYFRLPEQEATKREYPYITLDLIAVVRDPSREHRGRWYFEPENMYQPPTREPGEPAVTDYPIPMLLTYQVTQFARFIQHDRQIMQHLLLEKLPERFGSVIVIGRADAADDNSIRRLELVGGPTNADAPDPADPNKRIFRKAYTVEISSEIFLEELKNLSAVLAPEVVLDVHDLHDPSVHS